MEYQNRLNRILAKPGNKNCADCNGRNPRWASISLGVFVCIRCCGLHRALGAHISKMKSTTLDKWSPQMFVIFEGIDNEISNHYWEANLPKSYSKPNESSAAYAVETFLRDKYERKMWKGIGEDPVSACLQPKTLKKEQEKKEDKRNLSAGPFNTDLLMDGPLIKENSVKSEVSSQHGISMNGHQQIFVNPNISDGANRNHDLWHKPTLFPEFPEYGSLAHGAIPSTIGNGAAKDVLQFATAGYSNSVDFGRNNQFVQPENFHNQKNFAVIKAEEDEKNKKISQVLSMYAPQPAQPTIPNNPNGGFKPLGAIAAQNFFNQNSRSPPYPTF
jgi:stromal membrane-associated protein